MNPEQFDVILQAMLDSPENAEAIAEMIQDNPEMLDELMNSDSEGPKKDAQPIREMKRLGRRNKRKYRWQQ